MGPLISQSFVNDAVEQGGRFDNLAPRLVENGYANASSFSIRYDAATQSYTVTNSTRTMTFTAADEVSSGSVDFKAYGKSSGNTADSLSLTTPGTTGALQYRYVGGGAWESIVADGTARDFSYTPFTYGVATPDANLQRSGGGGFAVSLVGARQSELPYAMAGSGTMQVDFTRGTLSSSGVLTTIDVKTGYILRIGIYYGSAGLSSSANAFAGAFSMHDTTRFTGQWAGRFYGPNNEEVGATWSISNEDGEFGAGYLIGRQDGSVPLYNDSLVPIRFSEDFGAPQDRGGYSMLAGSRYSEAAFHDNGNGTAAADSDMVRGDNILRYDADTGSFTYLDDVEEINTRFSPGSLNASASNAAVSVYELALGGTNYRLTLLKPGAENPDIALTYTSYGRWQQMQGSTADARDRWFAWGVRTNAFQIPTGTGHFDGLLVGTGTTTNGGAQYSLTGTSSFDVDFGAATFTGALHPIGTDLSTSAMRDFGAFSVTGGIMDLDGGLAGNVMDGSDNYLGFFEGALYGPQATELGGTFGFRSRSTVNSTTVNLTGAVVAKQP